MTPPSSANREFFERLAGGDHLGLIFDHLPNPVAFFVKDAQFRLVAFNELFWRSLGVDGAGEIEGKTDFDLFPKTMAEHFRRDDTRVFRSGEPVTGIVEPFFNSQGLPDWCITDKFPLRDAGGEVIGLMGVTQRYDEVGQALTPNRYLQRALTYIREHYWQEISAEDLAAAAQISTRQLNRIFSDHLGTSPHKFIMRTRVLAACEMLRETDTPIVEIAGELGFCDQSAFSKHFRSEMGVTPLRYRRGEEPKGADNEPGDG